MKQQTLRKIGNSVGIIIPKDILNELDLFEGKKVYINKENNNIVISKDITHPGISPEFLRVAEKVSEKYKTTFQELAKI